MPHRSRKNKNWCRGKEGMKHHPEIVKRQAWPCRTSSYGIIGGGTKTWYSCWHEERCSKCGKVLRWRLKEEECPEWRHPEDTWMNRLRGLWPKDLDNIIPDL